MYILKSLLDVRNDARKKRFDFIVTKGWFQVDLLKADSSAAACAVTAEIIELELQYFGHLMRIVDSFEKTLMLGKIEVRRRRGRQRMRWLDGIRDSRDMSE